MKYQNYLILFVATLFSACHQSTKEISTETAELQPEVSISEFPAKKEQTPAFLPAPSPAKATPKRTASTSYQFAPTVSKETSEEKAPPVLPSILAAPADSNSEIAFQNAEPAFTSLQELYRQQEKPMQIFTFLPQKDTVFTGQEGTKIFIPANAFVSEKTGKPVNGLVQLKLREYYSLADMLLANLATKSGADLLETGGMVQLEAFAGTEKLKIKEGNSITLSFPTTSPKPNMQLFNGAWQNGQVNWVTAPVPRLRKEKAMVSRVVSDNIIMRSADKEPQFPGGPMALRMFIDQNLAYPFSAIESKKEGRGVYSFRVNPDGNIAELQVLKSVDSLLDKAAFEVFAKMPKWIPGEVAGQPAAC